MSRLSLFLYSRHAWCSHGNSWLLSAVSRGFTHFVKSLLLPYFEASCDHLSCPDLFFRLIHDFQLLFQFWFLRLPDIVNLHHCLNPLGQSHAQLVLGVWIELTTGCPVYFSSYANFVGARDHGFMTSWLDIFDRTFWNVFLKILVFIEMFFTVGLSVVST